MAEPRYRLMDLFAGCGGMTRGFVDSGRFAPIFAVEFDLDAAATYAANFGSEHVSPIPIEEVPSFPKADVVIGGPPCQGFSPLNRNLVGFERRGLWRQYLRALTESDARAFVMENVPQLLKAAEYEEFAKRAKRLGYRVEKDILNAADFGVPQRRRRAIVIGVKNGPVPWPCATHADPASLPRDLKATHQYLTMCLRPPPGSLGPLPRTSNSDSRKSGAHAATVLPPVLPNRANRAEPGWREVR